MSRCRVQGGTVCGSCLFVFLHLLLEERKCPFNKFTGYFPTFVDITVIMSAVCMVWYTHTHTHTHTPTIISICVCTGSAVDILLTSPVLVAQIGEPPEVSQSDQGPCHRQHELQLVRPLAAVQQLVLLRQPVIWSGHLQAISFETIPGHIQRQRRIHPHRRETTTNNPNRVRTVSRQPAPHSVTQRHKTGYLGKAIRIIWLCAPFMQGCGEWKVSPVLSSFMVHSSIKVMHFAAQG